MRSTRSHGRSTGSARTRPATCIRAMSHPPSMMTTVSHCPGRAPMCASTSAGCSIASASKDTRASNSKESGAQTPAAVLSPPRPRLPTFPGRMARGLCRCANKGTANCWQNKSQGSPASEQAGVARCSLLLLPCSWVNDSDGPPATAHARTHAPAPRPPAYRCPRC